MTAIVGVLNKQAIAVAADSAVTVGAGVKVYDKANKIFTLSKHHPVGVAIYSSASFNSCIPWEIIIKMFRKKIGKDEYESIKAYADAFISYLKDFKDKNTNIDELNLFTSSEISRLWTFDVLAQMPNSRPDIGLHKDDVGKLTELFTNINANISNNPVIPELSIIDKPSFVKCYDTALKQIKQEVFAAGGDQKLYDLVEDTFFNLFTKDTGIRDKRGEFTGISFFGYGSEEIFPSLYRIHVYNCINGIVYWRMIEYDKVENMGNQSYICPMAQIDEMQTYITGINPVIEDTLISGMESIMKEFLSLLAASIHSINPAVAKNIAHFDVTSLIIQYKKTIVR